MIQLKNIKKKYKKKLLFSNVNLVINGPGIYSFIGDNGCGKTTLLNIIGKIIKPSKGKIKNKHKTIFISQELHLIENLKVKDYFKMFNIDINVLKSFHLFNKKDNYLKELSFGEKQRIICILGVHSNNEIIIFDEPTSHLDKYNASLIMNCLKRISKDKIILLVSHDLNFIKKYSDEIYEINNKKVELIKKKNNKKEALKRSKPKYKIRKYKRVSFKNNKRNNFIFFIIYFFVGFMLLFTSNLREYFNNVCDESISNSLDYNKFYLKECEKKSEENLIIKRCFNIGSKTKDILKKNNYIIYNNYDLLMNNLYDISNFNVIRNNNVSLKEGRYPLKINEIIANDDYKLNDKITLKTNKVINSDKVDIYSNTLELEVVGIVNKDLFNKSNSYYLDYDLLDSYLKKEKLINNKINLYEYFNKLDIDSYKYVLYFDEINLDIFTSNNIEYLSSSYDYYNSLKSTINKIVYSLRIIKVIIVISSSYYLIKLTNKRIKIKENDLLFFKCMGIRKRKIKNIMFYDYNKLIIYSLFLVEIISVIILKIIFNSMYFSINNLLIIYLFIYSLSKLVFDFLVRWRKRI